MPTILNEDLAYEWLLESMSEDRITEVGTTVSPSDHMTACTIVKDFKEQIELAIRLCMRSCLCEKVFYNS